MKLNLFNEMFPFYMDYKCPMWSKWEEKENELVLNITVPGYEKEDFSLSVEDDELILKIQDKLIYSIVSNLKKYKVEKAKALYRSGVLKITIPKKEVKKVEIEVS